MQSVQHYLDYNFAYVEEIFTKAAAIFFGFNTYIHFHGFQYDEFDVINKLERYKTKDELE